jgi:hypothetical protein
MEIIYIKYWDALFRKDNQTKRNHAENLIAKLANKRLVEEESYPKS